MEKIIVKSGCMSMVMESKDENKFTAPVIIEGRQYWLNKIGSEYVISRFTTPKAEPELKRCRYCELPTYGSFSVCENCLDDMLRNECVYKKQ